MIEAIAAGTRLRRKGRIVSRDQAESGSCDFGEGEKPTIQVSWGDVATAFHSTGIPNIEVQFEELRAIRAFARTPWFVKSFLGLDFMQNTPLPFPRMGSGGVLERAGHNRCGRAPPTPAGESRCSRNPTLNAACS